MNLSEFTYLLNHPQAITPAYTDRLDKVLAEFPYFQSARALRLKGLYNEDSFRYNYALKVTAAYTQDRSVLFDFITSNQFQSVNREYFIAKQEELKQIEVQTEEVFSETPVVDPDLETVVEAEKITQTDASTETLLVDFAPNTDFQDETQKVEIETSPESLVQDELAAAEIETEDFDAENDITTEDSSDILAEEDSTSDSWEYDLPLESAIEAATLPVTDQDPRKAFLNDPATLSILESIREATVHYTVVESKEPTETLASSSLEPEAASAKLEILPTEESQLNEEEARLEIGKPLEFNPSELHSFHEWLQLSSFKPIEREQHIKEPADVEPPLKEESTPEKEDTVVEENVENLDLQTEEERRKKLELIDKFIETNPKIPPIKKENPAPALSIEPSRAVDNSYLMTETLARVYLEQKKYDKAIQAYEILILKYPEKSSFFADRILDIKTLKNNNNN